jgi:hypothetical protein
LPVSIVITEGLGMASVPSELELKAPVALRSLNEVMVRPCRPFNPIYDQYPVWRQGI